METYSTEDKKDALRLITHVQVEQAHQSDANALLPVIESAEARNLKPKEILADSLYGSDDNCQKAETHDVEKKSARITYKGYTGYMPMVGHLAENGLIIGDEFREGNEAPAARYG